MDPVVYLVRHGQSTWNLAAKRLDLWTMFSQVDHPLTPEGVAQAKRLRDLEEFKTLSSSPKSRIFSSPLTRAVQTTVVAAGTRSLTLLPDAREIAWPLAGPDSRSRSTGEEVLRRALDELSQVDKYHKPAVLAESMKVDASRVASTWWSNFREPKQEMLTRLQRLLRSLRPLGAEWSSSILVCHSLLIQRLFKDFASTELEKEKSQLLEDLRQRKLQNCGVVKVSLDDANLIKDAELVFDTKLV